MESSRSQILAERSIINFTVVCVIQKKFPFDYIKSVLMNENRIYYGEFILLFILQFGAVSSRFLKLFRRKKVKIWTRRDK